MHLHPDSEMIFILYEFLSKCSITFKLTNVYDISEWDETTYLSFSCNNSCLMSPYSMSHKIILFDNNYLPKLRHTRSLLQHNLNEHLGGFCYFSIGNNLTSWNKGSDTFYSNLPFLSVISTSSKLLRRFGLPSHSTKKYPVTAKTRISFIF